MSVIVRMRRQDAVYWPPGLEDIMGQRTYGPPVPIKCRWEDVTTQLVGRSEMSKSTVYVDRVVELEGVLWKGKKSKLIDQTSPFNNPGAGTIQEIGETPNMKATEFLRWAKL